jgi:putative transposase
LDGGKKVNGRKRHIAVDTLGLMLICICTAANIADSVAGSSLVADLNNAEKYPRLEKILGDNGYRNVGSDLDIGVTIEAAERKEGEKGFVPEAFRWAVERTFAWLNRNRRLVRNYEKKIRYQESMNYIANARLCIRRLENLLAA